MLTGLRKFFFSSAFLLLFAIAPAQDITLLQKEINLNTESLSIEQFLKELGSETGLGMNFSKLPAHRVSAKSYSSKSVQYILEDVLREIGWYYELLNTKSLVLKPIDWNKPGPYSYSGIIVDEESGNALDNVVVYSKYEPTVTRTNSIGFFQINLYYLPQDLCFYLPGRTLSKQRISTRSDLTFIVVQLPGDSKLDEVVVKGRQDTASVVIGASRTSVDVPKIASIPSALSSSGIINSLKYSSGFQSAVEANNALIVRGGNDDQNLVLFDGVPVYNPLHVPGWFSIFNKNSVASLDLIKGGIPSKFGGRLSSVIQTESKKGSLKKWHGSATLSPFAGELSVEGPLIKEKLSFIFSGRRTFTDYLVSSVQNVFDPSSTSDFNIYFFDLSAGLHCQISPKSSLDLVSYFGGDRGYIRSEASVAGARSISEKNNNDLLWSNSLNSLTYKAVLGNRLVAGLSAKFSSYGFNYQNNYEVNIFDEQSDYTKRNEVRHQDGIRDLRFTADFNYHLFSKLQLDFGAGVVNYRFIPANTRHLQVVNDESLVDTSLVNRELSTNEAFTYAEAKLQRKRSTLQVGTRAVYFSSAKEYFYLEPRFKWTFYPGKRTSFMASYNLLQQNVFSVTANDPGISYSIWLPITDNMDPLRVHQWELGFNHLLENGPTVQIGAYYKLFSELPDYQTNIVDFITDNTLTIGSGKARGIELGVQQDLPRLSYWFGYTLAKSTRQFPAINNGEEFPFRFDRRHDISLVGSWKFNHKWKMGVTWIYNSGNYVTLPVSRVIVKIDDEVFLIEKFGNRNNYKLPDYHRLDIGFSRFTKKKKSERTWTFTLYNVYNQQNPYFINLSFNDSGEPILQSVNLLPFLPSIQYAISF